MTTPRYETVNEDARFCARCDELGDVDAAGLCDWCAAAVALWTKRAWDPAMDDDDDDGERRVLPFPRGMATEGNDTDDSQ